MWTGAVLLLLCSALWGLDALEETNGTTRSWTERTPVVTGSTAAAERTRNSTMSSSSTTSTTQQSQRVVESLSPRRDAPAAATQEKEELVTAEPLEDELDNQENIISQLLGDYDKVKTVSSGSDCVCRCVVRPIRRSDCSDAASLNQASYSVETITKGTDCKKCVCMAPPSAVNPCEGEYRFKKLQEASKDDIKLSTIMDLLEGSLYGLDLLKLQSVTTKLLNRMDHMEKAFVGNWTERTREKERLKAKEKEKKIQQKKKKAIDLGNLGQKTRVPANANKQKSTEGPVKKNPQPESLDKQQQPTSNKTGKTGLVIKGVTFYKAEDQSFEETERGRTKDTSPTVNSSWDSLISDRLPPLRTLPVQRPAPAPPFRTEVDFKDLSRRGSSPRPTKQPTNPPTTTSSTTPRPTPTTTKAVTDVTTTTPEPTTTKPTTTTTRPTTTLQPTTGHMSIPVTQPTSSATRRPANAPPTAESQTGPKSRLSWTESPVDQPKATKRPGVCKDTVASLSDPVQYHSYGLSDGAWMRDARGHGKVIYLTNGLYGNNLLEFRDINAFKSGQVSNSYKLPYSFTGTGHVVFNGAFYYNRAFSRDVIRYELRHRYVAAWSTLHDALLDEHVHRTQSEVEFAVDESGLWVLYPALDTEGFHQEVVLLVHLNHRDLQPIRTFRTGLRRGHHGNNFLVCGVLYGVNSVEHRNANVTYAFDTHTLTHTVPSLAVTNMHGHTSQLAYSPLDKKLYAWDNGHQMMYDVVFAY